MKKILFLITFCIFLFSSCDTSKEDFETVNVAKAEMMSVTAFRSSVDILPSKPIIESGKIYAYNNLVLVNDVDKGIHIIDNSDPSNPHTIAFIKILANKDMEIKGDYLFADSLMDLVVFDISNLSDIRQVARLKDVFPGYVPMPQIENLVFDYGGNDFNSGDIVVGYTITQEQRSIEEINQIKFTNRDMVFAMAAESAVSTGQGGSLARFKTVNGYLYVVDSHSINIFNIDNLSSPKMLKTVFAGYDIETIFNRGTQLFLGSMSGMYVYDITKPEDPNLISEFKHGTACDPVVVDDKYAYITLRAGNFCGAFDSSLQIVNIEDVEKPYLEKAYPMDGPYGLGIKDDKLFVCDGASGLKVYDKTDVKNLKLLNHFKDVDTYDVIPMENHLLMIGDKTLYQYNYSSTGLTLLSQYMLK